MDEEKSCDKKRTTDCGREGQKNNCPSLPPPLSMIWGKALGQGVRRDGEKKKKKKKKKRQGIRANLALARAEMRRFH
jgi:hypothetical protein